MVNRPIDVVANSFVNPWLRCTRHPGSAFPVERDTTLSYYWLPALEAHEARSFKIAGRDDDDTAECFFGPLKDHYWILSSPNCMTTHINTGLARMMRASLGICRWDGTSARSHPQCNPGCEVVFAPSLMTDQQEVRTRDSGRVMLKLQADDNRATEVIFSRNRFWILQRQSIRQWSKAVTKLTTFTETVNSVNGAWTEDSYQVVKLIGVRTRSSGANQLALWR
ncbi:predicted protein [Aspergillus nidulans FGSC A4]|uniref:Uncharacterized protein n=1 Tax=Emericella nidulans (strain FGSC A4 / ATCC 38163 / CBS 112.46 / NRRL 194 / M139) TaxID=227321 RepID=Q5BDG3_EMENI|nr:hypothetical protein [Aspergillus nidulans FGSC A4]EAA64547.1 predicted protein [Aspergillus nidulans FGSC A4]CBF84815.1 TPA: conserved hypothetical protein [Aspergillus nidulans FGSC A4]|eukprot:XP_659021.1 predicted protein [Aspergillus nidulans FGSC A4]